MKLTALSLFAAAAADYVDLVTFDGGDSPTNWKWEEVNDPVMGGQSSATFTVHRSANGQSQSVFMATALAPPHMLD